MAVAHGLELFLDLPRRTIAFQNKFPETPLAVSIDQSVLQELVERGQKLRLIGRSLFVEKGPPDIALRGIERLVKA